MTAAPTLGSPSISKHAGVAVGIAALVSLALALLCSETVREFFPYAEEWKILLPSLPQFAKPLDWFGGFAGISSEPYPAWSVAAINFCRPVMNAVYWLRGALFGDNWGAYLYVNFVITGLAAGTLYLCLRTYKTVADTYPQTTNPGFWLASLLVAAFIALPAMVSTATAFLPILLPQMPFGRLVATFGLLACLALMYQRYWLAAALLTAALMTKETALPVAIALPLTHAWLNRRQLRLNGPAILILAAPLLAWIGLRLWLFGSVLQGVYVLQHDTATLARRFVVDLLKLPLYAPSLSAVIRQPFSFAGLLLACNLTVLIYVALDIFRRWRSHGPDVISVAAIGYWGFLAIVGLNPRYGALIIALTILIVARPVATGVAPALRSIALAALLLSGVANAWLSLQSYPVHTAFSHSVYQVGREYAAALAQVDPAADTIVVLNDPNTMFTAPADMAKVLQLPLTNVHKASDFPWAWPTAFAREIDPQPCSVAARYLDDSTIELQQSCGLQIMGALVPNRDTPTLTLDEGIEVKYPQASFNAKGYLDELGQKLILHIHRPGVRVLYFDPQRSGFIWLKPGNADQRPESKRAP